MSVTFDVLSNTTNQQIAYFVAFPVVNPLYPGIIVSTPGYLIVQDASPLPFLTRQLQAIYQAFLWRDPPQGQLGTVSATSAAAAADTLMTSAADFNPAWWALAGQYVANGGVAPTYIQWLGALLSGQQPPQQILDVVNSDNFRRGSNPLWVAALFYATLQRDPSSAELGYWTTQADSVAPGILFSPGAAQQRIGLVGSFTARPEFTNRWADRCDLNGDGQVSVADVQVMINEVLGTISPVSDLNGDGRVDVADVQFLINVVLGTAVCPN